MGNKVHLPRNAFDSRFLLHQELNLTTVVHVGDVYRPVRVGYENGDVLELFLSAVVLFVKAQILHEVDGGAAVDENDITQVLLDVVVKAANEIGAALDGHESVEDLVALEEILKDFDGAEGVDVKVDKDECAAVAQRVEKLAAKVRDVHNGTLMWDLTPRLDYTTGTARKR